jgi:membrane protein implicated in regulation of membrane protease activity
VRNSNILFLVAFLILGWFGAEVFTAQNICVTSCVDLSGLTSWEQAIAVAILPIILVYGGIRLRKTEKQGSTAVTQSQSG